jgi:hypothetical protein
MDNYIRRIYNHFNIKVLDKYLCEAAYLYIKLFR